MKELVTIVLPLIIVFYFPMFGKVIPVISSLPYNFINYSLLSMLIFTLLPLVLNRNFEKIDGRLTPLIVFNLYIIANQVLKGLFLGSLMNYINATSGVILSTLIILFFSQLRQFGRSKRLFDTIATTLAIMLFLQVLLSLIESASGTLLGDYEISKRADGSSIIVSAAGRDLLTLFGLSQKDLFGLEIAFTGLIGQHNAFGIMLVFYNVFFLAQYEKNRNKYRLLPCLLIIIALIGNGTRSAIFIVLLTDFLYIFFLIKNKMLKISAAFLLVLPLTLILKNGLYGSIIKWYYQSDSLTSRLLLWKQLPLMPKDLFSFLFGKTIQDISLWIIKIGEVVKVSFESEFFNLYLKTGFIGMLLFLCMLLQIYRIKSFRYLRVKIISNRLLVLNICFVSFFMTGIIHYTTYTLITLIILYYLHQDIMFSEHAKVKNIDLPCDRFSCLSQFDHVS
ncbi:hypothetical protein C6A36_00180 [Desulfobacteraceae bacterium SEEP-SAG10]|nr:hypothetical protein C6A36_00180 [Desulfobacteraceae bacterium SEEP-SAG10]